MPNGFVRMEFRADRDTEYTGLRLHLMDLSKFDKYEFFRFDLVQYDVRTLTFRQHGTAVDVHGPTIRIQRDFNHWKYCEGTKSNLSHESMKVDESFEILS